VLAFPMCCVLCCVLCVVRWCCVLLWSYSRRLPCLLTSPNAHRWRHAGMRTWCSWPTLHCCR
jgi:hypothetical protein